MSKWNLLCPLMAVRPPTANTIANMIFRYPDFLDCVMKIIVF